MGDLNNDAFLRNQNAGVQSRAKAQNRANVLQLKAIGSSHPTGLTPNLLKLFEPRPPLDYKPPPEKRKCPPYTGMAHFVRLFAEPGEAEYAPPIPEAETSSERKARIHQLRLEKGAAKAAEELEKYDPQNDPNATGDPYKTLFVAMLNYETSESRLKREFETYGPIKRWVQCLIHSPRTSIFPQLLQWRCISNMELCGLKVNLVYDKETNKPKGYAFIEFAHTRDMKTAYKQADGRKIDGRRVLVDVERGRTVPNWRPRRLGGGLGTTRVGDVDASQKNAAREVQPGGPSRSAEPRVREDREREKSREKGREREKSRERSHERPRDREPREDRHHRDRDRTRDKEKERDRGRDRDRTRERDRGRDRGRDYERERDRERPREKERDYDTGGEGDLDRGRSRDRDYDHDHVEGKHERGERDRGYDHDEDRGWYESEPGQKHSENEHEDKDYDRYEGHGGHNDNEDAPRGVDDDRYNNNYPMDEDNYKYDPKA